MDFDQLSNINKCNRCSEGAIVKILHVIQLSIKNPCFVHKVYKYVELLKYRLLATCNLVKVMKI